MYLAIVDIIGSIVRLERHIIIMFYQGFSLKRFQTELLHLQKFLQGK